MGIEFNEPTGSTRSFAKKDSIIIRAAIGMGLANDRKGAERILLILAIIAIVIAVAFPFLTAPQPAPPETQEPYGYAPYQSYA